MGSIRLENIGVQFGRVSALEQVDATFEPGSMTAIVGENGAGKSTLLRAIMGLVPLASGRVSFDGLRAKDIAYLPQAQDIDRSFPIDVSDFVSLGAWPRLGLFRGSDPHEQRFLEAAIERVGLEEQRHTVIGKLSGGQFQRALFARLILQDSPVLLLDEPFSAVDTQTTIELMDLLRAWHAQGRTIIAVLHDLGLVAREFPEALLLNRRLVARGASVDVLSDVRSSPVRPTTSVAA